MSQGYRSNDTDTLRGAPRRFVRALAAQTMLRHTARIEATVHAAQAEGVFRLEAALRQAWPFGEAPIREVMWAAGGGDARLQLQAFDAEGRLLLARDYAAGEAGK